MKISKLITTYLILQKRGKYRYFCPQTSEVMQLQMTYDKGYVSYLDISLLIGEYSKSQQDSVILKCFIPEDSDYKQWKKLTNIDFY